MVDVIGYARAVLLTILEKVFIRSERLPARLGDPEEIRQQNLVWKNPNAIEFIENPSLKVQLIAVERDPFAVLKINNPPLEVLEEAIRNSHNLLRYMIKNIDSCSSEGFQLFAVREDSSAIEYMKDPSESVQIAAVTACRFNIKYIDHPSLPVQFAAIREHPGTIMFIKEPAEAVQLEAVRKRPDLIAHIKDPSAKVLTTALKYGASTDKFLKNSDEEARSLVMQERLRRRSGTKKPMNAKFRLDEKPVYGNFTSAEVEKLKPEKSETSLSKWVR